MECIKYINDLDLEIQMLKDLKGNIDCDDSELENKIQQKELLIEKCKANLSKLSSDKICYRIYLHMLNGLSISKAIEKVAEENLYNDKKPSTPQVIWRNYYPILKKFLKG